MASDLIKENYGVLQKTSCSGELEEVVEQVKRLGYAKLSSGYSQQELDKISDAFNIIYEQYIEKWGADKLRAIDEFYTIRAMLTQGENEFLKLVNNQKLIGVVEQLIQGKFILNQQNGVINPPQQKYNQAAWHRDLPYQHFVSSTPLAINALYCVDDFTLENGATHILPCSHKHSDFPSEQFIKNNAIQVEAKAGEYIVLDCMLFHSGGFNSTEVNRRAVNHVFTIPYFKQQINLCESFISYDLTREDKAILGCDYQEPKSIIEYLNSRKYEQ